MSSNAKSRGFGKKGWMIIIFTLFISVEKTPTSASGE